MVFSTFTEVVGAGPSKHFDILGIKMFDSAEIRIHPTGAGIVRAGTNRKARGTRRTWAQIVAEELGLDAQTIMVEEGDSGHGAVRSGHLREPQHAGRWRGHHDGRTPHPREGAQDRRAPARGRRGRRRVDRLQVPGEGRAGQERHHEGVAFAAYTNMAQNEPGLEATFYYDPPNMTYPNGAYVAVVDVDRDTGDVKVRASSPWTIAASSSPDDRRARSTAG